MPQYDFRCKACGQRFSLRFKSYADYDAATPRCPACESSDLARLIKAVAIPRSGRDYARMSSGEMLSVLESGDERQVDDMFKQVQGRDNAESGPEPGETP